MIAELGPIAASCSRSATHRANSLTLRERRISLP
jgi:hypothetical protein